MKYYSPIVASMLVFAVAPLSAQETPKTPASSALEEVASFEKQQPTGIAVSKESGRVFVNFPFWSDDHTISVAEVGKDGKQVPYPDAAWNSKEGAAEKRFVCVQSVYIDDKDALWILDAGSPKQEGVVPGGAKLVKVDMRTYQIAQIIPFEDDVAPKKSYLNDVRVDTETNHAFITESGVGSLIVVDLKTGKKRRVLANHPSTKIEVGVELKVDGIKPIDPKTKGTPQFHADGIALDNKKGVLYYHALTARTLYSIKTADLINPEIPDKDLEKKVVKVAKTPSPDGMLMDSQGRVLLADFEGNAISRFDPETEKTGIVLEDKRLQWPDSMSWGPEDYLYVTTSQIHRQPKYNEGVSKQTEPFRVYRLKVPGAPAPAAKPEAASTTR